MYIRHVSKKYVSEFIGKCISMLLQWKIYWDIKFPVLFSVLGFYFIKMNTYMLFQKLSVNKSDVLKIVGFIVCILFLYVSCLSTLNFFQWIFNLVH